MWDVRTQSRGDRKPCNPNPSYIHQPALSAISPPASSPSSSGKAGPGARRSCLESLISSNKLSDPEQRPGPLQISVSSSVRWGSPPHPHLLAQVREEKALYFESCKNVRQTEVIFIIKSSLGIYTFIACSRLKTELKGQVQFIKAYLEDKLSFL